MDPDAGDDLPESLIVPLMHAAVLAKSSYESTLCRELTRRAAPDASLVRKGWISGLEGGDVVRFRIDRADDLHRAPPSMRETDIDR